MSIWERSVFSHSVEEWCTSLVIAAIAWLCGKLLYWLSVNVLKRWVARTRSKLDDILLGTIGGPVVVIVTLVGFYIAFARMEFHGKVAVYVARAFQAAWTLSVTWAVVRVLGGLLREYLLPYAKERSKGSMDENVISLSVRAVALVIWGLGFIAALNNVGYDVSALLAGIGISGLALAMAAKDTLANIFGGITVFADRPFHVGDRIRIGEYDGTVMRVGMRSTRMRTLEGSVAVIPNFKFTDTSLENVSEEIARRVRLELGLVHECSSEEVELALTLLGDIVRDAQQTLTMEHTAYFQSFKDRSLNIVFIYYIRKGMPIEAAQNMVNLNIHKRFSAAGLRFAYPTQVEYSGASVAKP